jgi:hypothetical protein
MCVSCDGGIADITLQEQVEEAFSKVLKMLVSIGQATRGARGNVARLSHRIHVAGHRGPLRTEERMLGFE